MVLICKIKKFHFNGIKTTQTIYCINLFHTNLQDQFTKITQYKMFASTEVESNGFYYLHNIYVMMSSEHRPQYPTTGMTYVN